MEDGARCVLGSSLSLSVSSRSTALISCPGPRTPSTAFRDAPMSTTAKEASASSWRGRLVGLDSASTSSLGRFRFFGGARRLRSLQSMQKMSGWRTGMGWWQDSNIHILIATSSTASVSFAAMVCKFVVLAVGGNFWDPCPNSRLSRCFQCRSVNNPTPGIRYKGGFGCEK